MSIQMAKTFNFDMFLNFLYKLFLNKKLMVPDERTLLGFESFLNSFLGVKLNKAKVRDASYTVDH